MGLYPSMLHNVGLRAPKEALHKREQKKNPTEDLLQMEEFFLKKKLFEFNNQIKQQISGTALCTKCAPTYTRIFLDKVETEFSETQTYKLFWWLDILMIFSSFERMVKKK